MVITIVINIKKNVLRYKCALKQLKKYGLNNVIFFDAIDGNVDLHKYKYKIMENFINPYNNLPIRNGEIGCALSHYYVWKFICDNKISEALILEDDILFLPNFKEEFNCLLNSNLNYDLFFFNRFSNNTIDEININNKYVKMCYSYNASSYLIKNKTASILLNSNFIENIIPVDEFLPIMYDEKYPHENIKNKIKPDTYLMAYAFIEEVADQNADHFSQIETSKIYNSFGNVNQF
jgi:GR25 family glycosyltransferase involved in LPS biosynthesis